LRRLLLRRRGSADHVALAADLLQAVWDVRISYKLEVFFMQHHGLAGASAEEEIDEPTGKFLGPCRDGEYFKLRAYLIRAN
jgi:hypothetical protein